MLKRERRRGKDVYIYIRREESPLSIDILGRTQEKQGAAEGSPIFIFAGMS